MPFALFLPLAAVAAPAPVERFEHVSVQVIGRGSPVVLFPGLSSPRAVWDGVVPALARDHRVYVVQVNGFGGDDPGANVRPGVLEGAVAELHRLLARDGQRGAAVVGHSMGGLLALMLARAHPADVERIMVVDAFPYAGEMFAAGATVAAMEPQARAMRDRLASAPASPAIARAAAERMALTPDARGKVAGWSAAADPRVVANAFYEIMTTDLRRDLAGIAAPVTIIHPSGSEATYRRVYAPTPNVRFVGVADAGHFVMLDRPQAFADALSAFLRD